MNEESIELWLRHTGHICCHLGHIYGVASVLLKMYSFCRWFINIILTCIFVFYVYGYMKAETSVRQQFI